MRGPNILLILSDDQGPWAMHCAGTEELVTPNLDRLSREGIRMDQFYCASPVCSPARASLLTGRMPSAHGVHDWLASGNIDREKFADMADENPYGGYRDEREPIAYLDQIPCYSDMLCEQGYRCSLVGKWHLGDSERPQHGFSGWQVLAGGGCEYMHPDFLENGRIVVHHGEYVTDLITDRAVRELESLSGQDAPFYLSVHYTAPHNPWQKEQHPAKWTEYYDKCTFDEIPDVPDHPDMTTGPVHGTPRRRENLIGYFSAVSAMDEGIGRILDALDRLGIGENTMVIFMSDNGMSMGHHGIWGKGNGTYPMNMYDEAVRVPFLIRWSGLPGPGRVCHAMASAVDLYPFFCDVLGCEPGKGPGQSFLPALLGKEPGRERVVVFDEYGPVRMIRTREWKYIRYGRNGREALYHLSEDPGEMRDCMADGRYRKTAAELRAQLDAYFHTWSEPGKDGEGLPVTGSGQFDRSRFGSAPLTYKEQMGKKT